MKDTYSALFPMLSDSYPDLFIESAYSWDLYLWGHTTVATRLFPSSFSIPNNENAEAMPNKSSSVAAKPAKAAMVPSGCLIPGADLINHQAGTCLGGGQTIVICTRILPLKNVRDYIQLWR